MHATVGTAKANSAPNAPSRVRARTISNARATSPERSDATFHRPGCTSTLRPLVRLIDPFTSSAPVRSCSWPRMMFTATPVRNPTITEWDTNRV